MAAKSEEVAKEGLEVFVDYVSAQTCPLVEGDFNPVDVQKVYR